MTGALQGLRVLELGQVMAAPWAGEIFCALGAEVVKIERVDGGDDARRMGPPFRGGDALLFQILNAGKRSVALDLKSEAGMASLHDLLAQTDILVHNLRPGVAETLGIDAGALCERYPRLIYGEISAFGNVGPMRLQPGYEPLIQAFSGMSSANGGPADPPMRSAASLCDQGSGMWLVIGALSLLQQRTATGRGGVIRTSLLETAMAWNAQKSDAFVNEGVLPRRDRSGHPTLVPYQAFEANDSSLLICCGNDRLFTKLCRALGHPAWAQDARFITNRDRLMNKDALVDAMAGVLGTAPRDHWLGLLSDAGVPCAPVHSIPEALQHEQVQALGMRRTVPGETFSLTGLPLLIDGVRPHARCRAPTGHGVGDELFNGSAAL